MEFLPLSRRRSSSRNVPCVEERSSQARLLSTQHSSKKNNLKKKDHLFQLTWLSLQNLIMLYYMPSTQICPNETRSTQSGRVEAISGVEVFYRVFGEKSQKNDEWYANTRYRNFLSLSQEK